MASNTYKSIVSMTVCPDWFGFSEVANLFLADM